MFDSLSELAIIVLFLALLYFGWKSTEVRDTLHGTTLAAHRSSLSSRDVAIVPVRGNLLNRLVDQITIGSSGLRNRRHHRRGLQTRQNNSVEEIEYNEGNILMTHVLSWASNESISTGTNTETTNSRFGRQNEYLINQLENEEGPAALIREMDRDLDTNSPLAAGTTMASVPLSTAADSGVVSHNNDTAAEEVQNCTNENSENGNKQETVANAGDSVDGGRVILNQPAPTINEETWKIKIKYLNDDMKVVDAKPSQSLGEFKKQNFETELSANKLVRLVFNGKVLQPDGASLRSCALFENCVVHCLVHNMPPGRSEGGTNAQQHQFSSNATAGGHPGHGLQLIRRTIQNDVIGLQQHSTIGAGMGLLGGPEIGDEPQLDRQQAAEPQNGETGNYSAAHLMRNRFQQWMLQVWNQLYNWRFFTELLLAAFTIITIYLRVRYAELFTATATIGLILVSIMVLGISVTLNLL